MRRVYSRVVALALLMMTGCPSEFGKDGRVHQAIRKDMADMVIKTCSDERRSELCGNGQENSRECLECGGLKK